MKIAFAYPTNRNLLLKNVQDNQEPDNALYGYNHIKWKDKYICEVNQTAEKILNLFFHPLNLLFIKQIDIDFKLARAILMIPQLNKADVIVSNIDGMSLAICFLKRLNLVKAPIIYSVGLFYIQGQMVENLEKGQKSLFLTFYQWLLGSADSVIYHAEIEKEKLQKLGFYNPFLCTFIPIGSDEYYFKRGIKITPKNNLVVSVGKDRARDYKTLIQAAEKLPSIKFIIACRKLNVPKIPIPKNVSFLYELHYRKVKELYQNATLIVIPIKEMKRSSGQMTLTDSMQAGLPIIISSAIGIAHYNLQNKENSILVKPGNSDELKEAISNLIRNKTLRNKLSINIKKVGKYYTTKNFASKLTSVITQTYKNPRLYPISKDNLEYLKNIRNGNNQYFLNNTQITSSQQLKWYEDFVKKERMGEEYMFILKDSHRSYGTGAIYNINRKNKTAEIGRFIIEQSQRGKGYGDILIKEIVIAAFTKLNLKELYLEVLADNKEAIKLYIKHKFKLREKTTKNGKQILQMSYKP